MTAEEAIEILKRDRDLCNFNPMTGELAPMNEGCKQSAIAYGVAISALEKQIAKKPIVENVNSSVIRYKLRIFRCTQCKTKIIGRYCEYCGQAICWED